MKIPKRKRSKLTSTIVGLVSFVVIAGAGGIYYSSLILPHAPTAENTKPPIVTRDASKKVANNSTTFTPLSEIPTRITIEKIGVNAPIEPLGLTPDGLMDAPKTNEGVGWYDKSARAGEDRYAMLLDGHYGTEEQPAVFKRLVELTTGDTISITGQKGAILTYALVETEQRWASDVDMKKALNRYPDTEQSLTIITCEGLFDAVNSTYDKRTVVYAKRIK